MPNRSVERLKALTLILMAIYYATLLASGTLFHYVSPRLGWLAILCSGTLILIASAYALTRASDEGHIDIPGRNVPIVSLVALAIPILIGVTVPAQTINAEAANGRDVITALPRWSYGSGQTPPAKRSILDWVVVIGETQVASALDGQHADVTGFVHRDSRLAVNQFYLARITLACCLADAQTVAVVIQSDEAAQIPGNTWARVIGVFRAGSLANTSIPILVADEVAPIQEPDPPYLFP